ncbi:arsenate reductase ArsC [Martelella sp. AD-3]|uniref:arsenate reductase ArsC n=1 Tax=Martelella sp. AD-3 TaxID=686597 RepID=UPI000466716C|nr:arsenate reductase ArsC [Martelella sp. AD-3]AMM85502.1 ArsR family transcriptional regulator [Martelella sp. AD-3]MAM10241.1 arsenate reductase ArsC [Rhizobiaceae bacterium]|tara:strand:+ start:172 stop:699 length:528 start_codon:yes stop_codon:yes gene_type:complete
MTEKTLNVLFLCTGNSARSILAESILNGEGNGRFRAFSAGSHPKDAPNPLALETLKAMGYRSEGFRSKSWDEFTQPGAPEVDFIITVCDSAAGEACPIMRGPGKRAHWGVEDPSHVEGTHEEKLRAFAQTATYLKSRIMAFINLYRDEGGPEDPDSKLKQIGAMEGATEKARKAD